MTDHVSHVGYLHATGNALYGEISDIVKQREKDEGRYKKKNHLGVSHFSNNGVSSRRFFSLSTFHATALTVPMR